MQISGTGKIFNGRRYNIAESITIGRSSQCNLSTPKETKGISRIHCRIDNCNGALQITDLGSSYGTFVNNVRIPQNTPMRLNVGDSFYLGGRDNSFWVIDDTPANNSSAAQISASANVKNTSPIERVLRNTRIALGVAIATTCIFAGLFIWKVYESDYWWSEYHTVAEEYQDLQDDTLVTKSGVRAFIDTICDWIF